MIIYAVRLTGKTEENVFEKALSHINEWKREKIKKFYKQDDALRALTGEVLSRVVICKSLEIKNKNIVFTDNGYGKPLLKGYPDYHFNISHAGEWIVMAADNNDLGIDVEKVKPVNFKIAKRFFSPDEYNDLMTKPETEKTGYFFDLWTLKESYIKATGRGLGSSLSSFYMKVDDGIIVFRPGIPGRHYYFKQYDLHDNYKMAVCSLSGNFPEELQIISLKELMEEFMRLARIGG